MSTSHPTQQCAYVSCSPTPLKMIDPQTGQMDIDVTLLARRRALDGELRLLIEQDAVPRLLEISADITNLTEREPLPEPSQERLVPARLAEALKLISTLRDLKSFDDVSELRWQPEPSDPI